MSCGSVNGLFAATKPYTTPWESHLNKYDKEHRNL